MSTHMCKMSGTCAVEVSFDLDENDIVRNVSFTRGCNGNAKGVAMLAEGMAANELVARLEGISCDNNATSCPDQFAKAIKNVLSEKA